VLRIHSDFPSQSLPPAADQALVIIGLMIHNDQLVMAETSKTLYNNNSNHSNNNNNNNNNSNNNNNNNSNHNNNYMSIYTHIYNAICMYIYICRSLLPNVKYPPLILSHPRQQRHDEAPAGAQEE
jgi:hypothetical protein